MRHPNQSTLALHAGGDLGRISQWFTARHIARCESCREEVAAYDEMRQILPEMAAMPEIPWNRLAAEVKANIRLGLAAGECVRQPEPALRESALFTGGRMVVALASIVVLVATGFVLEHPTPPAVLLPVGTSVHATRNGIEANWGGSALGLMNSGGQDAKVVYSMSAQGSIGARYVDPETGGVTINTVYVQ